MIPRVWGDITPGVEVVLEAYEGYWRHVPDVNRLAMRGVPEEAIRLAMWPNTPSTLSRCTPFPSLEDIRLK